MEITDWIAQQINLKKQCELIRGKTISANTWLNWEKLAGACYPQGKKVRSRRYTDEQTQLLLCLAYMRRYPSKEKITYTSLRVFWEVNSYKIEEVFERVCNGQPVEPKSEPIKQIRLREAKLCCDRIMGRKLSPECWSKWKLHLGVPKNSRLADEGKAALLTFMACWRQDNPSKPFPSVNRLLLMMQDRLRQGMTLETLSSGKMLHKWEMQGCLGKELPKYLAAHGYKISLGTLYAWGEFKQRKHYSVAELAHWRQIAYEKRYGRLA